MALVLFAHGSGSSRHSPRNQFVARTLNRAGLGTLLFDLLTPEEEALDIYTREHRFNIGLLAERLVHATNWARQQEETRDLRIGYFGSSTGGAAALVAAAELPQDVGETVAPAIAAPIPNVKELALALKSASNEVKNKIMGGMSQRASAALKEEMEMLGPARKRDIESAQTAIVAMIRKLEDAGEIVVGEGRMTSSLKATGHAAVRGTPAASVVGALTWALTVSRASTVGGSVRQRAQPRRPAPRKSVRGGSPKGTRLVSRTENERASSRARHASANRWR